MWVTYEARTLQGKAFDLFNNRNARNVFIAPAELPPHCLIFNSPYMKYSCISFDNADISRCFLDLKVYARHKK